MWIDQRAEEFIFIEEIWERVKAIWIRIKEAIITQISS